MPSSPMQRVAAILGSVHIQQFHQCGRYTSHYLEDSVGSRRKSFVPLAVLMEEYTLEMTGENEAIDVDFLT